MNLANYITNENLNNYRVEEFEILIKEYTYSGTNTIYTDSAKFQITQEWKILSEKWWLTVQIGVCNWSNMLKNSYYYILHVKI